MQLFPFTFSHSAGGVKCLLGSESLSHESWKNCQDDNITNINTSLVRCWFPSASLAHFVFFNLCQSSNCSSICDYWGVNIIAREHFYFLLTPLTVHQWSPASQLRPSSSIRRLASLRHIARSKDLEKSGSRSCVFISVSLSNKHQQPAEQHGLSGISFFIWQARLITALLYNATHVATHHCCLSLFPYAGKCTAGGNWGRERAKRMP